MFHPQSFNPISFSSISFNGANKPVQEGRSGYWRLFFTQLQEQSEQKQDKVKEVSNVLETSPKPSPIQAKNKPEKVASKPRENQEKALPFRPLPMFERKPLEHSNTTMMYPLTVELRLMVAQFNQTKLNFVPYVSANDEEDLELLLLVA